MGEGAGFLKILPRITPNSENSIFSEKLFPEIKTGGSLKGPGKIFIRMGKACHARLKSGRGQIDAPHAHLLVKTGKYFLVAFLGLCKIRNWR